MLAEDGGVNINGKEVMNREVDTTYELKKAFMNLFPDAVPGSNGDIKMFTSFEKEYRSITKGVGVRSLAGNVILKFTGDDVLDFLHRVSTNDVKNLGVFKHKNTLFTNEKGRLIDRTTLMKIGDYFLLAGSPDPDEKLKNWIEKYIIMEDIKVEDVSNNYTIFELYGGQTNSFMTMLCGEKINDLDGENITIGETGSIKTYITKLMGVNNIDKYWIIVDAKNATELVKYLKENKSAFDINFIGDEVFEYFRIQNGIPKSPNEINANYNPHEVNLIKEVSFTKGCYIGQEVIARLDTYDKVQRNMKGIKLQLDKSFELPIQLIDAEGGEAGEITSLIKSKQNEFYIGLALVRKKSLEKTGDVFALISTKDKIKINILDLPITE